MSVLSRERFFVVRDERDAYQELQQDFQAQSAEVATMMAGVHAEKETAQHRLDDAERESGEATAQLRALVTNLGVPQVRLWRRGEGRRSARARARAKTIRDFDARLPLSRRVQTEADALLELRPALARLAPLVHELKQRAQLDAERAAAAGRGGRRRVRGGRAPPAARAGARRPRRRAGEAAAARSPPRALRSGARRTLLTARGSRRPVSLPSRRRQDALARARSAHGDVDAHARELAGELEETKVNLGIIARRARASAESRVSEVRARARRALSHLASARFAPERSALLSCSRS